jgi:hypothetical protein
MVGIPIANTNHTRLVLHVWTILIAIFLNTFMHWSILSSGMEKKSCKHVHKYKWMKTISDTIANLEVKETYPEIL